MAHLRCFHNGVNANFTARACEAIPGFPRADGEKCSHEDWNLLTTSESDTSWDFSGSWATLTGYFEGTPAMNPILRRCSIGILSGAAASTVLTTTLHHGVWSLILGVFTGEAYSAALRPKRLAYVDSLMTGGSRGIPFGVSSAS